VLDGGAFPIAGTSAVLSNMRTVLEAFRATGRPIVHIIRIYEQDGSNADLCRRQLLRDGASVVLRGSLGCQIAPELLPDSTVELDAKVLLDGDIQQLAAHDEVAIYKPRWGAFYNTPLEQHLRHRKISTIVFAGCNFPNCPRTSIYEASERDFRVVVVTDAISGLYDRGQEELSGIGVSLMTAAAVAEWMHASVASPA
jgi:nicotinamidase-related amidase